MSPIALLSHWLDLCPKRHAPLQDVRANRLQGDRARGDRAGTAQGAKGGQYREGGTESLP